MEDVLIIGILVAGFVASLYVICKYLYRAPKEGQ